MANNPADQVFARSSRSHMRSSGETARKRPGKARMPSSTVYLFGAIIAAIGLFFALWWVLKNGGEEAENAWLPAGLAASVVLLVALSAREVVMRRAWTRYLLENGITERPVESSRQSQAIKKTYSTSLHSAALRTIQKQSRQADSPNSPPDAHLDVFHLCQEYLDNTEDALRTSLPSDKIMSIRAGQERVRALQKHHMLTWARDTTRQLTREAQQRARMSDKIETANRALDCLDSALKIYPDEPELKESTLAIKEFVASVKVAHWVELAERSAFKGHYKRAIDRYKDALFYLNRETVKEEVRIAGGERIEREIEALRQRLNSSADSDVDQDKNGGGRADG